MDVAWLGEGRLIHLHSMVLWGYYELDLHDACIPFRCNLIALNSVYISHVQQSFFILSGMVLFAIGLFGSNHELIVEISMVLMGLIACSSAMDVLTLVPSRFRSLN